MDNVKTLHDLDISEFYVIVYLKILSQQESVVDP
jgi:hypothetical protein